MGNGLVFNELKGLNHSIVFYSIPVAILMME